MSRKEILNSPEYWIAKIQMDLYNCAEEFMETNDLNRRQLAEHLGVSKGYVSQLLNGDYDHKLSKLVELSLAFGFVPKIDFQPIEEVISEDSHKFKLPESRVAIKYASGYSSKITHLTSREDFEVITPDLNNNAA